MRGLLLHGDTERSAALRHEIPIAIIDSLLFAEVDGRRYVLTTQLESDRINELLPDAELLDYFALGYKELVSGGMSFEEASREDGVVLTVDDAAVTLRRRSKSPAELDGIRAAQRAAEAGMTAASELLARAQTADGRLELDGKPLLAEDVRSALRAACAEQGAPSPPDVIVASVWDGFGHNPGSGPLPAGLPIHVDLWPRDEESACWADMARTFVVGEPPGPISARTELVREALEQAKAAVRPGVTGRELYDATCDLFEGAGYATQ